MTVRRRRPIGSRFAHGPPDAAGTAHGNATSPAGDLHVLIAESERLQCRSLSLRQLQADLAARAAELRAEMGELRVRLAVTNATRVSTSARAESRAA